MDFVEINGLRFVGTDKRCGVHWRVELPNNRSKYLCKRSEGGSGTSTDMPVYVTCEECQKLITKEIYDEGYRKIAAEKNAKNNK